MLTGLEPSNQPASPSLIPFRYVEHKSPTTKQAGRLPCPWLDPSLLTHAAQPNSAPSPYTSKLVGPEHCSTFPFLPHMPVSPRRRPLCASARATQHHAPLRDNSLQRPRLHCPRQPRYPALHLDRPRAPAEREPSRRITPRAPSARAEQPRLSLGVRVSSPRAAPPYITQGRRPWNPRAPRELFPCRRHKSRREKERGRSRGSGGEEEAATTE